jgi:hypothetical protein
MILLLLIISVLGFAGANIFGKKLWHKVFVLLFGLGFIASLCLLVLNDHQHFGMDKVVKTKTTNLVSSADSQAGPEMLLYQPLGDGTEKIYLYKTDRDKKIQKTGTDNVKNDVKKNADQAQLAENVTVWSYEKDWAKLLFGIADNDQQFDHQENTFSLPQEWLVLSVDQAKNLGNYLKEHQQEIQNQAKQYVAEKVTALMMENPTLSAAEQKQAAEKFGQEFQQQFIQKVIDGNLK